MTRHTLALILLTLCFISLAIQCIGLILMVYRHHAGKDEGYAFEMCVLGLIPTILFGQAATLVEGE